MRPGGDLCQPADAIVDGSGAIRGEAKSDKDLYRACMRARGYQLIDGGHWRGFRD